MNIQRRNHSWRKIPSSPERPAGEYEYTWNAEKAKKVFDKPLYQAVINSAAFQRLSDIRFLGAIDYFIHPTGRQLNRRHHTRLEHSLGVAHLALIYSRLAGLSDLDEALVVCAALLHDIGHPPLSHSIEGTFKKHFGIDHHIASAQIILGKTQMHFSDLNVGPILLASGIDPNQIVSLIAGDLHENPHNFLFAHPINIDTLEAISRSETYLKAVPISPTPDVVLMSLIRHLHMEKLDEFWALKDKIYRLIIQGPLGLYADHVALQYVQKNIDAFSIEDFFLSERGLSKEHQSLFACFAKAREDLRKDSAVSSMPIKIHFQLRRFFIDKEYASGSANRYKQSQKSVLIKFAGQHRIAIEP